MTVRESKDLLAEVAKAVEIAISGVPGPVHVAMPIDVQQGEVQVTIPEPPKRTPIVPELDTIKKVAQELAKRESGYVFIGQGVRGSVDQVLELAELLNWPIVTTPQAKGLIPEEHPLLSGVFGFAGHEGTSALINDGDGQALLILGSSLGETATNNWNMNLTKNRFCVQMDFDKTVFGRKYEIDIPVLGDINLSLMFLLEELKALGLPKQGAKALEKPETYVATEEYNTQNVLKNLQKHLPADTRYTVDIGEFMSYVIHYMNVLDYNTFDINVHFGAMGSGIGSAIGSKFADPDRPVVCITGDGCFFMHGMEILTAKEYNLPILFVIMNNARLGMVYHGHELQYKRSHATFAQKEISIAAMAEAMGIPSYRVQEMGDLNKEALSGLLNA